MILFESLRLSIFAFKKHKPPESSTQTRRGESGRNPAVTVMIRTLHAFAMKTSVFGLYFVVSGTPWVGLAIGEEITGPHSKNKSSLGTAVRHITRSCNGF